MFLKTKSVLNNIYKKKHMKKSEYIELNNKWESFSREEREFVINLLENFQIDKKINLSEARWWNTVGDVLGIFDPTGVVDFINGWDYLRQGDYFYGFLSMIAVIPGFGDAIAKPIMGVSKGSKLMKGMNEALRLSKIGKTVEAAKILENASKSSSLISKLINSSIKWGEKLKRAVDMIPGGKLTSGLRKTINDWIDLFIVAAGKSSRAKKVGAMAASKIKGLPKEEAAKLLNNLQKTISKNSRVFRNFKPKDPGFMAKYFWPGATVGVLWRSRPLASLARRTKWYAGLLSSLGLPFMEPEELPKQMSEEELNKKFQDYVSSEEGKKNWSEEFSQVDMEEPEIDSEPQMTSKPEPQKTSGDPLLDTFSEFFGV
jgi:hypothetical protein